MQRILAAAATAARAWAAAIVIAGAITSSGWAQELPDAPSPSPAPASSSSSSSVIHIRIHSQHAQWVALTFATSTMISIDDYQTIHGYREQGTPWLYGTYPSRHPIKVSSIMAVESGLSSTLGWYMQRSRHRVIRDLWWMPQAYIVTVHTRGVVHNFGLK